MCYTLSMETIVKQLNQLDKQYPNMITMPNKIRDKYNQLSQQLICQVWDTRLEEHGSIHSHLDAGEKPGKG